MEQIRRRRRVKSFRAILVFVVTLVLVIFGAQFLTKTGIFRVPGVVIYDGSLNSEEISALEAVFTDEVSLRKDVKISAYETKNLPDLSEGEYLHSVLVPVTDFYEIRTDTGEFSDGEYAMTPIEELDFSKKLLSMDGKYYLDDFDSGAIFRIVKFESDDFDSEIKPLVSGDFEKSFPEKKSVLTFAQTGVTALSRKMYSKLVENNGDAEYFAANIRDFLASFDVTHTSNESSFTEAANAENICSDPRFINTLTAIGLDVVELTGNHNQDCGDDAANETLDMYEKNNIKIVGGGKTANEAAKPLNIGEKNTNITFLAYNLSTGGATLDDTPGANQYYEENAIKEIGEAKERGDFVIVDVQYYECSAYASEYEDSACDYADSAAGDQVGFFRHLIDLGADLVVGTSAHQPQTFELYGDGAIYYGLGNLFFDQIWWPGTTRSLVLAHYFYDGKLLQTKVVPTVYDDSMQTKLLDEDTSRWFIDRLVSERP